MHVKDLSIGNIMLRKMTDELANELKTELENLIDSNPYLKKAINTPVEANWINSLRNRTLAEFKTFAEGKIAIERAKKESEKSNRFATI